jgi:hypothetical protein
MPGINDLQRKRFSAARKWQNDKNFGRMSYTSPNFLIRIIDPAIAADPRTKWVEQIEPVPPVPTPSRSPEKFACCSRDY